MDEKDFAEIAKRLEEVNKVITRLEPEVRSSAFELFKPYVAAGSDKEAPGIAKQNVDAETSTDKAVLERLIREHGTDKPSGNVHMIAAEWYSEYGCNPFSVETIKRRAESGGLTIPGRTDNTLKAATEDGKKLFQMVGDGFKPTVPGEMYFKDVFKVKKGTSTPPRTETS